MRPVNPIPQDVRSLTSDQVRSIQLEKINALLLAVRDRPFYRDEITRLRLPLESLEQIQQLPLLKKTELIGDVGGAPARIFDLPRARYTRLHQTSGTKGFPMAVLDTPGDWDWWLRCWDYVLEAAEVSDEDVALMAFSFGPFIGFWTANDALVRRGAMVVPGGGMSSENRLRMIIDHGCTLVCGTPTYALHLASVAQRVGINLSKTAVTRIIVAGEPGGSVPSIRRRIEQAWGARVIDHSGASEVGAWGFGSYDGDGIYVIETEFIAEILRIDDEYPSGIPVDEGQHGELVLTNLGRQGGPAIRYRTGDVVCGYRQHQHDWPLLWLDGGVLGRADDMLVIRGVNVFPSSIEAMVREIAPTSEFRMIASRIDEMDQLAIEIETDDDAATRLSELLRDRLAMRVPVTIVPAETLPRFEAKAKRLIDHRYLSTP